jgi:DNA polymerase III subunit alpha
MFVPIQNTTHFSLLNSTTTPESLVARAEELGYKTLGITDYHSISGAIEFYKACKDKDKKRNIKPIYGTKFRVGTGIYTTLIAKNQLGWKRLIKLISKSNDHENFVNGEATLSLTNEDLDNLIVVLGDLSSELHNWCFSSYGYFAKTDAEASLSIAGDIEQKISDYLRPFRDKVKKEDLFIQINLLNKQELPFQKVVSDILRTVAKKEDIRCLAGVNTHYAKSEDNKDLNLLLCSDQKTTFRDVNKEYWLNHIFFSSDKFALPSEDEVKSLYLPEELEASEIIAANCEDFAITSKPKLPRFECPNNMTEMEYLRLLAREGYKKKCRGWDHKLYGERANTEFSVIEKAGLPGYFLIVQDFVNYAKQQGWLVGPGRGSAAGSLVSYLVGITSIDPIPFNLLFERFYNEGRNSGDNVAYPDIDMDFPKFHRDAVIDYVRNKYGADRTAQICTFGRLQGRSALREVLRVNGACDINTINQISKLLPEENKIADLLEEDQETSIVRWTLKNRPKLLEEYCTMDDQENLIGDLSSYFAQAIRIEGVYKSQGKHAAAVVICSEKLDEICPMVYHQETGQKLIGYDMYAAESAGTLKFDFLGVAALDKIMRVKQLLRGDI